MGHVINTAFKMTQPNQVNRKMVKSQPINELAVLDWPIRTEHLMTYFSLS